MDQSKYVSARVVSRREVSEDLWSMRIRIDAPFPFKSGQYATLALEDEEGVHERPYSIVSSPSEEEVEFFFELVPHGEVTPRLYRLQPGDPVSVRKSPKGLFVLDRKSGHHKHLLVSTVTGVAPYLSMLRSWVADPDWAPPETRILLIHAGSRPWEFGYADELLELEQKLPQVKVVLTVSRYWEDLDWKGERGRAEDIVRKYADAEGFTPTDTTGYVCGHPGMIENVKGILQRWGFDKKAVHEEVYWQPPKKAQTATS